MARHAIRRLHRKLRPGMPLRAWARHVVELAARGTKLGVTAAIATDWLHRKKTRHRRGAGGDAPSPPVTLTNGIRRTGQRKTRA